MSTYVGTGSLQIIDVNDGNYYYIYATSPNIVKHAPDSATAGTFTTITTVRGKQAVGTTTSDYGYVTVTYGSTESARTASSTGITINPNDGQNYAAGNNVDYYTVKLYDSQTGGSLITSLTIPVVYKGAKGDTGLPGLKERCKVRIPTAYKFYTYSATGKLNFTSTVSFTVNINTSQANQITYTNHGFGLGDAVTLVPSVDSKLQVNVPDNTSLGYTPTHVASTENIDTNNVLVYYVIYIDADNFCLAKTVEDAIRGAWLTWSRRDVGGSAITVSVKLPAAVDGQSLALGDRVLITNYAGTPDAQYNGIYTVTSTTLNNWQLTRAIDFDEWSEIVNSQCAVELGPLSGDSLWMCRANSTGTINTNNILFYCQAANGVAPNVVGSQARALTVSDYWQNPTSSYTLARFVANDYMSSASSKLADFRTQTGSVASIRKDGQIITAVTSPTPPLDVNTNTTKVTNLNADMVDGYHVGTSGSYIPALNGANTWSATQNFAGITTSSSTLVSNLNAQYLNGLPQGFYVYGANQATGSLNAPVTWSASDESQYRAAFWDVNGAAWTPDTGWWWGLTIPHRSNSSSYNYGGQLAFRHATSTDLYIRNIAGGTAYSWRKVWDSGNDGSGSGLDADTVDGYHVGTSGSYIPRLDTANTWSNSQTFSASVATNPLVSITNSGSGVGLSVDDVTIGYGGSGVGSTGTLLSIGRTDSTAVSTPAAIHLGGSHGSNTAGHVDNLKVIAYRVNNSGYGLGVSSSLLEVRSGTSGDIAFFTGDGTTPANGNERLRILGSSGLLDVKVGAGVNGKLSVRNTVSNGGNLRSVPYGGLSSKHLAFQGAQSVQDTTSTLVDGTISWSNQAGGWNWGWTGPSYTRIPGRTLEFTIDTTGVSTAQSDHFMIGFGNSNTSMATYPNYSYLAYAIYCNKPNSGTFTLDLYSLGNYIGNIYTPTWGDTIHCRIVLKATGALVFVKKNAKSDWEFAYEFTNDSTATLYVQIAGYTGRFTIRDINVYDAENLISPVGLTLLGLDGSKVGIGRTDPNEALDIKGALRVSSNVQQGIIALGNHENGAGYYDTGIYRGGIGTTALGNYLNLGGYDGITLSTSNAAFGSQSVRMHVSGTSGNVGINTASPNEKLDVNGAIQFRGSSAGYATTQSVGMIDFDSLGARILTFGANNTTRGTFSIWQAGQNNSIPQTPFYINNSGYIGIGTTSPQSPLTVTGDGQTGTHRGVVRLFNSGVDQWACIALPDTLAGSSISNNLYVIGRGTGASSRMMTFHIPTATDYGSGSQPTIGFYSSGADKLFEVEASTGRAYLKGKLGLNTASPSTSIHINTTTEADGVLAGTAFVGNRKAQAGVAVFCHSSFKDSTANNNDNYALLHSSTGDTYINAVGASSLYLRTNNVNRLSFDSAGVATFSNAVNITGHLYPTGNTYQQGYISCTGKMYALGGVDCTGNTTATGSVSSSSGYLSGNLLDTSSWDIATGAVGQFAYPNESTAGINARVWDTDPWGARAIVWKATNPVSGSGNASGGWTTSSITINPNKTYRFSVWYKKTGVSTGSFYLGPSAGGQTLNLDGTANGNPYFHSGISNSNFLLDRWYLAVGYLHANGDTSVTSKSAIYDSFTGSVISYGTDYKQAANATTQIHRAYNYYDGTNGSVSYFYGPRIDEINGMEPSISQLLGITRQDNFISSSQRSAQDANTTAVNGMYYANANVSLFGQADGALISQAYNSIWQGQLYIDYRTGKLASRGKNNNAWQSWRTVAILDEAQTWSNNQTFSASSANPLVSITNSGAGVGLTVDDVVIGSGGSGVGSTGTLLSIGVTANTGVTTPAALHMGASYGTNTPGHVDNLKLIAYRLNTSGYGLGVSASLLEIRSGTNADMAFFIGTGTSSGTEVMRIDQYGRVGINTNAPDVMLQVSGPISSIVPAVSGAERVYYDVTSAFLGGPTTTGTVIIYLPTARASSNTMFTIRIAGYDYSSCGQWEAVVSGYNYADGNWYNSTAEIRGNTPFTSIRLGNISGQKVILLGTVSTVWNYGMVTVSEVRTRYGNQNLWGTGWSIGQTTNEGSGVGGSNITAQVTPTIYLAPNISLYGSGSLSISNSFVGNRVSQSNAAVFVHDSLKSTAGGDDYALLQGVSGATYLNAIGSNAISIRTGNTERLGIAANGDISVSSSTLVTNLNADKVDGYHVGTSGSTIPLLSAANTWSNNQTISGSSGGSMLSVTNSGAGDALTTSGTNTLGGSTLIQGGLEIKYAGNGALEIGRKDGTYGTPYIDFHTGGNRDFDCRILASGSAANASDGIGTLNYYAALHVFNNGPVKSASGIYPGVTTEPVYSVNIDFGNDAAGSFRKLAQIDFSNVAYAGSVYRVDITNPNTNYGWSNATNLMETYTYYVACTRSMATANDTDSCTVTGPWLHVRAVKLAQGSYEIQVRNNQLYEEQFVKIYAVATNGNSTPTFFNGSAAGSAGIATYTATVGSGVDYFRNLTAAGNLTVNGNASVTGTLTATDSIISSKTATQSTTAGAIVLNGNVGSVVIDSAGQKRITWNDGGATDFGIKSGLYVKTISSVTAERYVVTGDGASAVKLTSDGAAGQIDFMTAATGTADAAITWSSTVTLTNSLLSSNVDTKVVGANLILPKTSGKGIKLGDATPDFGWHDLLGQISPKTTGAGQPTRTLYRGNIYDFAFAANDMCDLNFHLPHDYLPGSDLYIHVHWSHTGTAIYGTATFTFYFTYAKGHNQAAFGADKSITISYDTGLVGTAGTTNMTNTPRYQHRVDEVAFTSNGGSATTWDRSVIEPDGMILAAIKVTSLPTITGGSLFIHEVDVHYQSTGIATKNKAPNFYN